MSEDKRNSFVMGRNRVLRTTAGHTIEFKKGEPTYVPPEIHEEATAAGAVPEDEAAFLEAQKEPPKKVVPTGNDRKDTIMTAMQIMVERNAREDFGANGLPTMKNLQKECNFDIDAKERDAIWKELQEQLKGAE